MVWQAILLALGIGALLTIIFTALFSQKGPWGTVWTVFLVLFLAIWASFIWVRPIGPEFYGIAWIPGLITGLIFIFILLAATPPEETEAEKAQRENVTKESPKNIRAAKQVTGMFWLMVLILLAVVAVGIFI